MDLSGETRSILRSSDYGNFLKKSSDKAASSDLKAKAPSAKSKLLSKESLGSRKGSKGRAPLLDVIPEEGKHEPEPPIAS